MKQIQSILAGAAVIASLSSQAALSPGYAGANFLLEVDGAKPAAISTFSGGAISAEVVTQALGTRNIQKKHLATITFEPITLEAGFSLDPSFYDWVSGTVDGNGPRKSGAILMADHNYKERSRITFQDAFVTEITIPAMDASGGREAGNLRVVVQPELIKNVPSSSGKLTATARGKQKMWLPSNFRLSIPGIDCSKVKKIESITIKQTATASSVGEFRDFYSEPGKIDYPNLRITVSAPFGEDFRKWHETFVVQDKSSDSDEKHATLSLLSANLTEEVAKLECYNVGISRLEQKPSAQGLDYVIDLYVERMELDFMAQFEK
jgi:phage tail-like protein